MTENESNELYREYLGLLEVLDFYSKHKDLINMTSKEYEGHINDILDKINEIKKELDL